jgi:hypothetical protein
MLQLSESQNIFPKYVNKMIVIISWSTEQRENIDA